MELQQKVEEHLKQHGIKKSYLASLVGIYPSQMSRWLSDNYELNEDQIKLIEDFAPKYIKEDFDNVGLMVGDKKRGISKILLALDCTNEVIEEAKINGVDLIITHHPLIFRMPSSITTDTLQGSKIMELIKHDIALYSAHTNLDSAKNGMNETIAKILGLKESKLIEVNFKDNKAGIGRIGLLEEEVSIEDYAKKVDKIIGVDRGCSYLLKNNIYPHYIVGDFDSINRDDIKKLEIDSIKKFKRGLSKK